MNQIIVEYRGGPKGDRDAAIDAAAVAVGLPTGDTGYDFHNGVRDHSIGPIASREEAEDLAQRLYEKLPPWAVVRAWSPEFDA